MRFVPKQGLLRVEVQQHLSKVLVLLVDVFEFVGEMLHSVLQRVIA